MKGRTHVLVLVGALLAGCSELPTRLLAPEVPVNIALPLVDSLLVLEQLIKDTAQIRRDPATGNLAIAFGGELTPVRVAEELTRIAPLQRRYAVSAAEEDTLQAHFRQWWQRTLVLALPLLRCFPQLPAPPAQTVVPSVSGVQVEQPATLPAEIQAVEFRHGIANLVLHNGYPVPLSIEPPPGQSQPGILLQTPGYGEWFVALSPMQRLIPPGETRGLPSDPGGEIRVGLDGMVLTSATRIVLQLGSPGSGGQPVRYDTMPVFSARLIPQGSAFRWAELRLPELELLLPLSVELPNQAALEEARLSEIALHCRFRNDLPISVQGQLYFPQLRSADGQPLTFPLQLEPKASAEWREQRTGVLLRPVAEDLGSVRVLRAYARLRVPSQQSFQRFWDSDTLLAELSLERFHVAWAQGERLPVVEFEAQTESEVWLRGNLGALSQMELELAELLLEAHLENSAAVAFRIEGTAEVLDRTRNLLARLTIPEQLVEPAELIGGELRARPSHWQLRYTDVVLRARPRFVRFLWRIRVEGPPKWAVADSSQIFGRVELVVPVRLRIQRLEFDTLWALTGGETLRRQSRAVRSARAVVEVYNLFPVALELQLTLADSLDSLRLPPQAPLWIAAAPVTAAGVGAAPQKVLSSFPLSQEQLELLRRADRVRVRLRGETSAGQYVRIRSSDWVHMRAILQIEYVP
jgi:hypothetical protein